ncbi:MAG: hypothetical protein Q9226_004175 [Calogaya cf. arnoldii]
MSDATAPRKVGALELYPEELNANGEKVDNQAHKTSDEYKGDQIQRKFDDKYTVKEIEQEGKLDPHTDRDLGPPLKDLGIPNMEDIRSYRSTEVFAKYGSKGSVTKAKYFPKKGIIVGEYQHELNAPVQTLNLSDITFLQWQNSTGSTRVGSLRAFIVRNITSRSTVEEMQEAQISTSQAPNETATFVRGTTYIFKHLMGLDFSRSLTYMLKDHAPVCR